MVEIMLGAKPYHFFVGFFNSSSPSFCYLVHLCSKALNGFPWIVFVM
jgi:hypothetical protein